MYLWGKEFGKGQKTFYPSISVKTPENRLILTRNSKFHPRTKPVEMNARGGDKYTSNLLISLVLMSPCVGIKVWRHKLIYLFPG